jgi:S-adenosylmethionine:tRNA ribosyltransferase-isomerase
MRVSDFYYDLPFGRIAQEPLAERDGSRLLLVTRGTGGWADKYFRDLPELLQGDELMVVNNARVIPVRLLGRRLGTGAGPAGREARRGREFLSSEIEVLLLREIEPLLWEALARPGRKVRTGETLIFSEGELTASVESRGEYGVRRLRFTALGDFREIVERLGHVPLPPYISRADAPADRERYQTIFASQGIAAAAPTAGLHFTPEMVSKLKARGIEMREITLEVGLGTFEPMRTGEVEKHAIHTERYHIPEGTAEAVERARREGRRILAVGTTAVRALEDSAARTALSPSRSGITGPSSSSLVTAVTPGAAEAEIYLYPGRPFRIVDALLTNFHLPQSSLMVMVAAFVGRERILAAYRHAVEAGYRFYSYGDCMLIT